MPSATTRISLVVTDLDGTLWDRHGQAHDLTLHALRELDRRGLPVLAATARRPASARQLMAANGFLLPAVLFDGSLGLDFTTGETFHRHAFEPSLAGAVLEALSRQGLEPCVNVDGSPRDVIVGARPSTHPAHLRFLEPWLRRGDLEATVRESPVLSFVICGRPRELLLPALEATRGLAAGSVSADLTYGGAMLSVRPPGVSKWNGVLAFCNARSLDPAGVLAVGDGDNDVELLESAAIACAVSDGCEAVLSWQRIISGQPTRAAGGPSWTSLPRADRRHCERTGGRPAGADEPTLASSRR
jgi:hydroxymethylpyrimidine pyrophosphatase-like HAD family hydrolase